MTTKQTFKMPYAGIEKAGAFDMLVGLQGEYSVVMEITNPVIRYCGSVAAYDDFFQLLSSLVKLLGEGYLLQKQDIIVRCRYTGKRPDGYLAQRFNDHFQGRSYKQIRTYLTITLKAKKGFFYSHDAKRSADFALSVNKATEILSGANLQPKLLCEREINLLVTQILNMSFDEQPVAIDNLKAGDDQMSTGARAIRSITLVDTDRIDLPGRVATHTSLNDREALKGFPVDLFSFLFAAPALEAILFNQVIEVPDQPALLKKLELKKKRHSGIPDPANLICVEDIDELLRDVAKENQILVNCHFNLVIAAGPQDLQKGANFIESALFAMGIIPGRNAYNQLELFRSALPGNAVELKVYDWFLTTCEAALCFFFKESLPKDEASEFLIRFTDRQGVPVAIDPSDLPMRTGRINNRNRFCLGASGSGKSFFINALAEQYLAYNMDLVIVDTGHSYSGLCSYFKGKYVTYTDKKPITMNPFQISREEYNIEKRDFLCTLISLVWKGAAGVFSPVERDVISAVVGAYYSHYFDAGGAAEGNAGRIAALNFNTFYEFALWTIPEIKSSEGISFDLDEFRYVLKKFYFGGEFASILNEAAEESLLTETFIVFEIDAIKENRILFPIVTLIIMDVFIQKMRCRQHQRKALIIEEAWKAIASPLMAGYLLYLYKTVRKFWGEAIVVTQELSDIIGNEVVKDSIISNSDTVCLLDQTKFKDNYDQIAALLSISETERRKIFTINQLDNAQNRGRFKEVYIRRGSSGEVYGVEVSLHQYLTYTTEKPEKSAVEHYTRSYGAYADGLDAFVGDFERSGLSLSQFVTQVNKRQVPAAEA